MVQCLRAWLRVVLMLVAIGGAAPCALAQPQAAGDPFTIGVLPNVSARLIFSSYQPMREYFERELGRTVEISTAPDFRSFSERTHRGDYQMVVTASNVGRVAQLDARWEPLAIYEPRIPAILVAAADNPDSGTTQLRGKSLAVANPQSLVALVGLQWLRARGLQNGGDYKLLLTANDDSLGAVLRSGEAPLAIMSMGEFLAKTESMRKSLRIVTEIAKLPGFLVMANPALPDSERQRLRALILRFPSTENGRRFLSLSGFAGVREVTDAELRSLDPHVEPTRAGLAARN